APGPVDDLGEERDVPSRIEALLTPLLITALTRSETAHDLGQHGEPAFGIREILIVPTARGDGRQVGKETLDRLASARLDTNAQKSIAIKEGSRQGPVHRFDSLGDLGGRIKD